MRNVYYSQKGSALIVILVAVALFGALSMTVAQMVRSGESGNAVSAQRASLISDEILSYARNMRQSVQTMKIANGCSNTDISFENTFVTGYTHSPVAIDDCKIFNPSGGGMNYQEPLEDFGSATEWVLTGANNVESIGTSDPDLVLILDNLNLTVCEAINDKLNVVSIPSDGDIAFTKFIGAYASTETLDNVDGVPAGCANYTDSGTNYFFYQVIVSR